MLERKEISIKNKNYFISHDYIRKKFEPNNTKKNSISRDNNSDFKKIQRIQKINLSNNQPLVLFNKPNKNNNKYKIENQIKKDLIENKGYINDGGYKKKLLKFYSYYNTTQNQPKNLFHSTLNQNKNKNQNQNFKRTSFSMDINKRTIQMDYCNSLRKLSKGIKIKNKEGKKNIFFNNFNEKDLKYRNLLIKKLTNKHVLERNLLFTMKIEKNRKMSKNEINFNRKKQYLEQNYISYENDEEENKKNHNEMNDINENKKNKKLKDIKDIKMNDGKMKYPEKKENNKINDNKKEKNNKKINKDINNPFEYIKKIRKEFNILRKSKEKIQIIKSAKQK